MPTNAVKVVSKKTEKRRVEPVKSAAAPEPKREPSRASAPVRSDDHEEGTFLSVFHVIYVFIDVYKSCILM